MGSEKKSIRLVGHPYAPIGMGEHVRCTYRALRSVAMQPTMTDIYKLQTPNHDGEYIDNTTPEELSAWINALKKIKPKSVMIYTIDRDTPAKDLKKIPIDKLNSICNMVLENGIDAKVYN